MAQKVVLLDVRLSFPEVFKAVQYQGQGPFNYRTVIYIPKDSDNHKKALKAFAEAANEKWGQKGPTYLKAILGDKGKCALSDGDLKEDERTAGQMLLTALRDEKSGPPKIVDRKKEIDLNGSEGKIYSGVRANAIVDIFAQDNKFGKGLRCGLNSLQFVAHAPSFGGATPASTDDFEDLEYDGGEDDDFA